jgi:Stress responsive A/B Barrel Domain.
VRRIGRGDFMLTHVVCWKYKTDTTDEQKAKHIEMLRSLPDVIPNIISFSVGSDVLHLERSFDTGLVAVYPDMAALDAYTIHDEHQKVAAFGKEIAERVVSVDFLDSAV